jgi:hypothetical protein
MVPPPQLPEVGGTVASDDLRSPEHEDRPASTPRAPSSIRSDDGIGILSFTPMPVRLLALGGIIGPTTFVTTWAIAGASTGGTRPSTIAVAATPLDGWTGDSLHGVFASSAP